MRHGQSIDPSKGFEKEENIMCRQPNKISAKDAGRDLARLMERQLGYQEGHIDSIALRLFIRAYWSRVSVYAHMIHEEDESTLKAYNAMPGANSNYPSEYFDQLILMAQTAKETGNTGLYRQIRKIFLDRYQVTEREGAVLDAES